MQVFCNLDEGIKEINSGLEGLLRKRKQVLVGIAGGTAAGKSYLAQKIGGQVILTDQYCLGAIKGKDTNFDEPQTYELELLGKHLQALKEGKEILIPVYDMKARARTGFKKFTPKKITIIDGIFALTPDLKDFYDIKVYVDAPEKERFERRMKRDLKNRIWEKEELEDYYAKIIGPMHKKYVEPTKKEAEIIINNP